VRALPLVLVTTLDPSLMLVSLARSLGHRLGRVFLLRLDIPHLAA